MTLPAPRVVLAALLATGLLASSCGGADSGGEVTDVAVSADRWAPLPDLAGDDPGAAADRHGRDVATDWAPCREGSAPGCPCTENGACDSGFCVATGDGRVCTDTCLDQCPGGWRCRAIGGATGDANFLCVPPFVNLCRPCDTGADCAELGGDGGFCVPHPGGVGAFCGAPCAASSDCPDGFACEEVTVQGGGLHLQCIPQDGGCRCNTKAVREDASTACVRSNAHGACAGRRACGGDGLGPCLGPEPAAEVCDGEDNDCDGEVDEVDAQRCTVANDHGACPGVQRCAEGRWQPCEGATPAPEVCDGVDNDCDGRVDDGFGDLDGDGLADCVDDDDDGDGVDDLDDGCPTVADPAQRDADGDGVGDACDDDRDGDGALDAEDCDPDDPSITCTVYYLDGDGDGAPLCDASLCQCAPGGGFTATTCEASDCDDDDADVGPLAEERCNGIDDDCDGLTDEGEPDLDGDGTADACDPDDDGDGVPDRLDVCPRLFDPEQRDCDGDGDGDLCDADDDDDGVIDEQDCAPCDGFVRPGVPDRCNGADDDCDGRVDEDCGYRIGPGGFGNGFSRGVRSVGLEAAGVLGSASFTRVSTGEAYRLTPAGSLEDPP